jgi:hypothetical protein
MNWRSCAAARFPEADSWRACKRIDDCAPPRRFLKLAASDLVNKSVTVRRGFLKLIADS